MPKDVEELSAASVGSPVTIRPYYERDGIKLYHGDCVDILPFLGRFDLALTDPPYGVTYQSNHRVGQGSTPITNDGTRLSLRLYRKVIPLIEANAVLWFTRWDAWPDVWELVGQKYPLKGMLVWDKGHNGMGDLSNWGCSHELIASAGGIRTVGGRDGSILRFAPVPPSGRSHPTEKPTKLLEYLISKVDAQTVIDPFAGSGATLMAARDLGRQAVGIEISEKYCEAAANRLSQGTLF